MEDRELVIIGGGPAGYVAAIRAAQLGGRATLIEMDALGGTCLNRGCVPSKTLLYSAELYETMKKSEQFGIMAKDVSADLARMQARKNTVIKTHVSGVESLLKGNKIEVVKGRARLLPSKQVEIESGDGQKQVIQAQKIILATGGKPMVLPIPGADSASGIINAEKILNLESIPKSIIMIGGGVIGIEMATILAKLGCQVSIVEMLPHILPLEDAELTAILAKALKDDGIQLYEGTKVSKIEDSPGGKAALISDGKTEQKLEAEAVAIAVGYRPNTDGLGLEEAGITINKGAIQVNERMETSVPGIYAAGDATGGIMLAYVAMEEGIIAAENVMGGNTSIDYNVVPRFTHSLPELASVGLTEEEARLQGHEAKIGRFPFAANSIATILGERRGLIKIVTEPKYGQILGIHILGPRATELIAEATLAMKMEATVPDIVATLHAHPSLSEAMHEAALDVTGETIHYPSKNR
ncbi:MAG: dihydrolipoyl dehydrogenase [Chloroflexota bacterium]|nr:dihydrolipoyl dehydrogenase [Chloroflexota bacterium]